MNGPKIQLSEEEWQLLQNSGWILTKHAVIDKVYHLFGWLAHEAQLRLRGPHHLPEAGLQQSPKISKGEQYQRLPWVVGFVMVLLLMVFVISNDLIKTFGGNREPEKPPAAVEPAKK